MERPGQIGAAAVGHCIVKSLLTRYHAEVNLYRGPDQGGCAIPQNVVVVRVVI